MASRVGSDGDGHGNGFVPTPTAKRGTGFAFWPSRGKGSVRSALVAQIAPKSAAAEAYRTLRTSIQFAHIDTPCRSIVVTSASAGEGKTTTAANFAVVAGQAGSRVCLVDADLRRPGLHRAFGLENTRGLTTALLDQDFTLADVAQPTLIPTLQVVTSGPLPPNPAELAGSSRMRQLIEEGSASFDLVILDSPPVIPVSDGIALAAHAEAVIMVVRVGTVPSEVVRRAVEQIESAKGRVLGVVLNRVNPRRDGDYYYQHYRYNNAYYGSSNGKR
jgi:capsular exopolysaccharide synthesis family protein